MKNCLNRDLPDLKIYRICNEPEFFGNCEHIFVERAENYVLSAVFLEKKSRSYMNRIQTFATIEFFVLSYYFLNRIVYGFTVNFFEHCVKFIHLLKQQRIVSFMFGKFMGSTQGYIGFYSKQKRTQPEIRCFPHIASGIVTFFVEQNCEQNGGVKVGYHNLESICSHFVVDRPKIYSFFWFCWQFGFSITSCQNHSACGSFLCQPLLKARLCSFDRGSADLCLRLFNSYGLHKSSLVDCYDHNIQNFREAA